MNSVSYILGICLCLGSILVQAKTPAANTNENQKTLVLRAVSKKYEQLQRWRAHFTQEHRSVGLGTGSFQEGSLVFEAPNRFKISTLSGELSDFISNGKQAWYVQFPKGRKQPALIQTFDSLESMEINQYLIFLGGIKAYTPKQTEELEKTFVVKAYLQDPYSFVELEPRRASEIASIKLQFSNNSPAPEVIFIEDAIGNLKIIRFTAWSIVPKQENLNTEFSAPQKSK